MSALVEWGRRKAALLGSTQLGDSGTGTGPWASFLPQSPCSPVRGLEDLWTIPHAPIAPLSLVPVLPASQGGDQNARVGEGSMAGPLFLAVCLHAAGCPLCLLTGLPGEQHFAPTGQGWHRVWHPQDGAVGPAVLCSGCSKGQGVQHAQGKTSGGGTQVAQAK